MKKKVFFSGLAALVVVAVAAWNFNIGFKANGRLTDTMLANVEALAQTEDGGWGDWTALLYGCVPDERYTCTVYEVFYVSAPIYVIIVYIDTFSGYKEHGYS